MMEFLASMFFIMSPFVLFCSESGNGLILAPICLILGFVCKWIDEGGLEPKNKVQPKDWWAENYKQEVARLLHSGAKGNPYTDKQARKFADYITRINKCPMPSDEEKERIAKDFGIVTEKMKKEENIKHDRIQIGKYFLLKELREKYHGKRFGNNGRGERCCYPWTIIKDDLYKIRLSDGHSINEAWIELDYKKTLREIWDGLSEQEKEQATKWIKEYEERMLKQIEDYIEGGRDFRSVHVDY